MLRTLTFTPRAAKVQLAARKYSLPASVFKAPHESEITQETMLKPIDNYVPLQDSFAVALISGHQYKVTAGDEIMVQKIEVPVLKQILLDKILLVGTKNETAVGTPLLTGAKVLAEIQEQSKTEKVIVFKKHHHKRKKRRGHRQPYTLLKIIDVLVEKE